MNSIIESITSPTVKKILLWHLEINKHPSSDLTFDEEILCELIPSVVDELLKISQKLNAAYNKEIPDPRPISLLYSTDFNFSEKYQLIFNDTITYLQTIQDLYLSYEKMAPHKYSLEINYNQSSSLSINLLPCTAKTSSPSLSGAQFENTLNCPISS